MPRILVVEDDTLTLEAFGEVLRDGGHDPTLATTVRSGLQAAKTGPYDLGLVDLVLPDGTAIQLLESLRLHGVTLPVIVITGESSLETAVEAMRRGAIDYAVKPLFGKDLLAKVSWGLRYAATSPAPRIPAEAYGHAATRWAALVVAILHAPADVRTNREWGRLVGVSTTTLRDWCRMARTSAAPSLGLGRVLRAVERSRGQRWRPAQHLSVSEPRTLARLIERSGLPAGAPSVTTQELLASQSFVDDVDALLALRDALARAGAFR